MKELKIPYYRSYPKAKVLFSEDTEIKLYDQHLSIRLNSIEEIPKSEEDEYLGTKEKVRKSTAIIMRKSINAIETGYDNDGECYDVVIFAGYNSWGYNFDDKMKAIEVWKELTNWLCNSDN